MYFVFRLQQIHKTLLSVSFEMLLKVSGTHQKKSGSQILFVFKSCWPSCSCLEGKEPIRKPLLAQSTYVLEPGVSRKWDASIQSPGRNVSWTQHWTQPSYSYVKAHLGEYYMNKICLLKPLPEWRGTNADFSGDTLEHLFEFLLWEISFVTNPCCKHCLPGDTTFHTTLQHARLQSLLQKGLWRPPQLSSLCGHNKNERKRALRVFECTASTEPCAFQTNSGEKSAI